MFTYTSEHMKYSFAAIFLIAMFSFGAFSQKPVVDVAAERARAMVLIDENKYLDAYPILEKIAPMLPNDVDVWTHYGIATTARSATLKDPAERQAARRKGYEILSRAKELGTENTTALDMLDQLPPDGGGEDNFSGDPKIEEALREGEAFFGRGEYDKAFASYESGYKLDPKNYEAILFMGDSRYAAKRYSESEPWFAKAAALDPDRDMAFRFWGDALLAQNKLNEAGEKFIDAFIADPYSRYAWDNVVKLANKYDKAPRIKGVLPPGTKPFESINIDETQLKAEDGTEHWSEYSKVKSAWKTITFKKEFPGETYRQTLKEEAAALRAVAVAGDAAITSGKLKEPHPSIANLVEINKKGLIEPYVLIMLPNEDIAQDYVAYRKTNRAKLRQFLSEFVVRF